MEETINKMMNEIYYLFNELTKLDNTYPNLYEISVYDRISDIYTNIFEVIYEIE
jgi:hypothetical protein